MAAGIPEDFSFYLIAIANAGSGAGRLFAGYSADKFGTVPSLSRDRPNY